MCADLDLALRRFKPGEDDFSGFDCGDVDLNEFIRDDAPGLEEKDVTRVYVAAAGNQGLGYVAIVADTIVLKTPEQKKLSLELKNVPAVKIGRLAVSTTIQGQGIGKLLVSVAYHQALAIRRPIGCRLLTVDAYVSKVDWYGNKLGFVRNKGAPEEDKCPLCKKPLTLCPHCQKAFPSEPTHTVSMRLDLKADPAPPWASLALGTVE